MKGDEKPLSDRPGFAGQARTNPYLRDPKLRDKMIVVAAQTSAAIEEIRAPQKVIAKAFRTGWKPRRPSHRKT